MRARKKRGFDLVETGFMDGAFAAYNTLTATADIDVDLINEVQIKL
jgi:hypothetical protein